jgi:hypothetical protein
MIFHNEHSTRFLTITMTLLMPHEDRWPQIYSLIMSDPVISLNKGNPNEVLRGQIQNQKPLLYVFDLDSYKSIDLNIIVLFFYAPVPAFPLWSFLHSALTKNYASFEVSSPCF